MSGKFDTSKLKREEETGERKYEGYKGGGMEGEESLMDRRGESKRQGISAQHLKK